MHLRSLLIYWVSFVIVLVPGKRSWSNSFVSAENITVYESDTVTLSCPVGESDDYAIWTVNSELSGHDQRRLTFKGALTRPSELVGRFSVNNDRKYHNLTILKVNLNDAGEYVCCNQWNDKRQGVNRLHIRVDISTLQNVESKFVSVGNDVILPCQAHANQNVELLFISSSQSPQITVWNGNVQDTRFTGRILKVTGESSDAFNLSISKIQRNDTGYYVCIENNGGNKRAHGVFLDVRDFPWYAPETSTGTQICVVVGLLGTLIGMISMVVFISMWVIRRRCHQSAEKDGFLRGEERKDEDSDEKFPLSEQASEYQGVGKTVEKKDSNGSVSDQNVRSIPTAPPEIMEVILLKAAHKFHNTVTMKPRGDVTTLTIMSSVCLEWWCVLMKSRGSKHRARRWLWVYEWLRFPSILQKAAILFCHKERKKLQKSRDADKEALKTLCVCNHWWLTMSANADVNRQQIKRLFAKVPRLFGFLGEDINNNDDKDVGEICRNIDVVDKREDRMVLCSPDNRLQRVLLNQSTEDHHFREVCGLTQVDGKIFVLININENGKSLSSVIDVFSNRRPFGSIKTIDISQLKPPQDIVACPETLQLFVSSWDSVDILRVDIKTNKSQKFDLRLQYCGNVTSISLSPCRLLVIFSRNSLGVFDVSNGEKIQFVHLPKPKFSFVYYAIESDQQTFFVSHANDSSRGYYLEISEINSGGQLIRSSGRQLGLTSPLHLTFDSMGRLLVADKDSHRILLLNEELKLERVSLKHEGYQPKRLNYNNKTDLLTVGFDGHHSAVVYKWKNFDEKHSRASDADKSEMTAFLRGISQLSEPSLQSEKLGSDNIPFDSCW